MSLSLLVFIGLNFAAAMSGALFKPDAWYRSLNKPSWQPPDWLFAPAWMILYAMIAVAGWLVWEKAGFSGLGGLAMVLYGLQLVLNAGWSAVFFGMRRMGLAFVEVIFLWLSVAATIAVFAMIDQGAAWLMVPYLAWVTFAAFLNLTVWRLNPDERDAGRPLKAGA